MKKYYPLIFVLAVIFVACKKNDVPPNVGKLSLTANEALVVGSWKWSAQYTYAQTLSTLNPANTGVQETLLFNANGTWTQTKNGDLANAGTYSFPNVELPGGPIGGATATFFSIVNSRVTDTARYDNFNFNTGFAGSFELTKDSLVFYGVNTIGASDTDYLAARVYTR
jgi:hypothetical protein